MTNVAQATQTVTTEFNGWSNRETWMVNLWLTNEECYYHELCAILKNFKSTDEQAEELEVYVRFIVGVDENVGITTDLLTTSLSRVDWCNFTLSRPPSSRLSVWERRRRSCGPGRAPPAAPFAFLRFPPPIFSFLAEKGLAGGG